MVSLTLNAPAKINIGLNIISKRKDGFHNLETFFYPINDLSDKLIFERSNHFIFDSNNTELNKDPYNLVLRSHTLIENYTNKKLPLKIILLKRIPIGAGLGGGSSDAASTLIGLNEFFRLKINENKLLEMALELGSDVPFFIKSKPAIGYSRGEILKISKNHIEHYILIVNPGIHISTKEAFSTITPHSSNFDYKYFLTSDSLDYKYLKNNISNDFEDYVFNTFPEIKEIKTTCLLNRALFSLMSGTGSTVYGIFEKLEDAKSAANSLPNNYFKHISTAS